jgi:Leu/Phe-tRNA-protein transferase
MNWIRIVLAITALLVCVAARANWDAVVKAEASSAGQGRVRIWDSLPLPARVRNLFCGPKTSDAGRVLNALPDPLLAPSSVLPQDDDITVNEALFPLTGPHVVEARLLGYDPYYYHRADRSPAGKYQTHVWTSAPVQALYNLDPLHVAERGNPLRKISTGETGRRLRSVTQKFEYHVLVNANFAEALHRCASVERFKKEKGEYVLDGDGNRILVGTTWLSPQIMGSFTELYLTHQAFSVEVYLRGKMVAAHVGTFMNGVHHFDTLFRDQENDFVEEEGKVTQGQAGLLATAASLYLVRKQGFNWVDTNEKRPNSIADTLDAYEVSRAEYRGFLDEARAENRPFVIPTNDLMPEFTDFLNKKISLP